MAAKNSSNKSASTPATPASASNVPVITPQAIAAADTADLLNEGTKCSSAVKAIGMNCPLPLRFKTVAEAIAAHKEQKAKLSAMEATLNAASSVFLSEDGRIFFGVETKKRLATELPWLELRCYDGRTFGFVDPVELQELDEADDSLDAVALNVNTDGVQIPIVFTEAAYIKRELHKGDKGPARFKCISVYADAYERLVETPYKETEDLIDLIEKAIEEMASKFGK